MRVHRLEQEQLVARPLREVFGFFSQARNLERVTPSFLSFEVLTPEPIPMRPGTLIDYRLRLHGLPLRWTSRIEEWEENRAFVDSQVRGPYRLWHHRHEFEDHVRGVLMRDVVHYALPLGRLGELTAGAIVRRDLGRVFAFRRRAVAELLA